MPIRSNLRTLLDDEEELAVARLNRLWKTNLLDRDEGLQRMGRSFDDTSGDDDFDRNAQFWSLFERCIPYSRFSQQLAPPSLFQNVPLNECVLAIAWDLTHCPKSTILSAKAILGPLADLLVPAAASQAVCQEVLALPYSDG